MKIIQQGIAPADMPWWVGGLCSCENCQTTIELEAGDRVISSHKPVGEIMVKANQIECPTCKQMIDV